MRLALIPALAFTLAACGGETADGDTTTVTVETVPADGEPEASDAPAPDEPAPDEPEPTGPDEAALDADADAVAEADAAADPLADLSLGELLDGGWTVVEGPATQMAFTEDGGPSGEVRFFNDGRLMDAGSWLFEMGTLSISTPGLGDMSYELDSRDGDRLVFVAADGDRLVLDDRIAE